jgi:peroxiredoxin
MKKFLLIPIFMAVLGMDAAVDSGAAAPSFTLTDIHGETVDSANFAGKVVVLEWINPKCPFVVKFYENGDMVKFQERARELGAVWISISSNRPGAAQYMTPEENKVWAEKVGHQAIWLMDAEGAMGKAYGAQVTPHMFVIDATGNVVYQGAIDSIRDANSGSIAKARNHTMEALEAVVAGLPVSEDRTRPYGCGIKY